MTKVRFRIPHLVLAVMLSVLLLLPGCATIQPEPPEVNLMALQIQDVTLSHVNLLANLRLFNPNPQPVRVSRVEYTLHLNGIKVMTGRWTAGTEIAANEYGLLDLRISSAYWNLMKLMQNLQESTEVDFSLAGSIRIGYGLAGATFPFKEEGRVPLHQKPD